MLIYKFSKTIINHEWREFHQLAKSQYQGGRRMATMLAKAFGSFLNLRQLELIDRRGIHNPDARLSPDAVAACSPWKIFFFDPEKYSCLLESSWEADITRRSGITSRPLTLSAASHKQWQEDVNGYV